ncbi:MAG: TIM barrel protein [Planctomycetota bacterium]|jgi:2,4-dienoyl-CoA reductase-like NADH-dependent reductase (Old Yellow Enzyme family)/sugar phosphate isomerase/epimerase|nr:TIM barrel protein [Planctomycetota bacterium]MDP6762296.1 TIM barrel protein [Planctomycetota bacterium]MDP6990316.1 TIM barrel protein [Planctomycetota bacterium]
MKLAVCNELFATGDLAQACEAAVRAGFAGLEIAPYTLADDPRSLTEQDARRLGDQVRDAGLSVVGLHWLLARPEGMHLSCADEGVRERTKEFLRHLARLCAAMGGDLLVLGSPRQRDVQPGERPADAFARAVEVCRGVCETAGPLGVRLAIEPLAPAVTNFLTSAAEVARLIEAVDHPACRLHLDAGAMAAEAQPAERIVADHAHLLAHVHANDPGGGGPGSGELDLGPMVRALREAGYDGWLSVEIFDSPASPERAAGESAATLERLLADCGEAAPRARRFPAPGRLRTAAAFREHLRAVADDLDCALEPRGADGPLGEPFELAGRTLDNRFAVHPMEGWDGTRDGLPTEHTLRRWERFGRSGAQLIWGGEAFAVREDGRANPNQLFHNPAADTAGGLAALLERLRSGCRAIGEDPERLFVGLQLTHSGRFARPDGAAAPRTAYAHPILDGRVGADETSVLTDGELESIGEAYVAAARLACEAGFDFVDVKCCHGYLMHELLGAHGREGPYGGSLANRSRLFSRIVADIQTEWPGLIIGARVSLGDILPYAPHPDTGVGIPAAWGEKSPFEHGFGIDREDPRRPDFDDPLAFVALARDLGVRLWNVSLGSPYTCPHLQRPATYPPSDGYLPPDDPLAAVAVHLRAARRLKGRFDDIAVVGTGYSYLQEWLPHVAEHELATGGVDFVGIGRGVLSYPELPRDVLAGKPIDRKRLCRTFSDCTTAPRNGIVSGCFPLDAYYKDLPEAARLKQLKSTERTNP